MRTIWKTTVPTVVAALQPYPMELPKGATLLEVREQHGQMAAWWEVDTDQPMVAKSVILVGTGHEIPEDGVYLGTGMFEQGLLVLHLYKLEPETDYVKGS